MPVSYTGGCQCGAIRYEVTDEPITLYACHCTACQTQSSSAFGLSMKLARDAFRLASAKLPIQTKFIARLGEEG